VSTFSRRRAAAGTSTVAFAGATPSMVAQPPSRSISNA
jgi:hypothetical protein